LTKFLNNVVIIKTKVLRPKTQVTMAIILRLFGFIAHKDIKHLTFLYFDFDRTWRRLFQKHVMRT